MVFFFVFPALAVLLFVSGIFQWSPLCCWCDEVDINSGRVRHTQFLLYCQIAERTEETWLSRSLGNTNTLADWRRVNTFSPGVHHSPHHAFHGAISQIEYLKIADDFVPFDPAARRNVAQAVLKLWQRNGSYFGANEYVGKITEIASALHDKGASTFTASDVPPI